MSIRAVYVQDPIPAEIEAVRQRRHDLGLDSRDEVWNGVQHMIPPPSVSHQRLWVELFRLIDPIARHAGLEVTPEIGIGTGEKNFRVPDMVLLRPEHEPQWNPTAPLLVEILSPNDTAWEKLDFYADHHVDELLYVDLEQNEVTWMVLRGGSYERVAGSSLIELDGAAVARHLGWA